MTRPFVIDEAFINSMKELSDYAENNHFTMDDLLDVYNNQLSPAGDHTEYTRILPFGYKVVFTIEEQPAGNVRHLSMSVDEDDKLPNEIVIREVMKQLGFGKPMEECALHLEDISANRQAINVLEIIK